MPAAHRLVSHLQQQHQLRVVDVNGDVERRLVKLAQCMDVSAVLQQRLRHRLVAVLRRPVQRRHLQHVLGVDVGTALRDKGRRKLRLGSGGQLTCCHSCPS